MNIVLPKEQYASNSVRFTLLNQEGERVVEQWFSCKEYLLEVMYDLHTKGGHTYKYSNVKPAYEKYDVNADKHYLIARATWPDQVVATRQMQSFLQAVEKIFGMPETTTVNIVPGDTKSLLITFGKHWYESPMRASFLMFCARIGWCYDKGSVQEHFEHIQTSRNQLGPSDNNYLNGFSYGIRTDNHTKGIDRVNLLFKVGFPPQTWDSFSGPGPIHQSAGVFGYPNWAKYQDTPTPENKPLLETIY